MGKTKHLYAVGSILGAGFQNATVWGSGFMNDPQGSLQSRVLNRKEFRKLDVRAVRGLVSREALLKLGHDSPEVYDDPTILMPEIYQPVKTNSKQEYLVISHFTDKTVDKNSLPIFTTDYSGFIDLLCSAERVISSSLHGIILAESYGIPAVLYLPQAVQGNLTLYKYRDYYLGTRRSRFPVAETLQEALETTPCALPELGEQRGKLKKHFL